MIYLINCLNSQHLPATPPPKKKTQKTNLYHIKVPRLIVSHAGLFAQCDLIMIYVISQ